MQLYTQRHGLRTVPLRTDSIDYFSRNALKEICNNYRYCLAHLCKKREFDSFTREYYITFNEKQFNSLLAIKIPDLDYHDDTGDVDVYEKYAIIDYIEFIAQNMRDTEICWNSEKYRNYQYFDIRESCTIYEQFQNEINSIFNEGNIAYTLTDDKIIVRDTDDSVLTSQIIQDINCIKEDGTRALLKEAIERFRNPRPAERKLAVEKIWDAFERLKTYYQEKDKSSSADLIIHNIAGGMNAIYDVINKEFRQLTEIGNNFCIRHFETQQTVIIDERHYDYFFNRCLALISLAIKYLK